MTNNSDFFIVSSRLKIVNVEFRRLTFQQAYPVPVATAAEYESKRADDSVVWLFQGRLAGKKREEVSGKLFA
jgi:hypothetical protein